MNLTWKFYLLLVLLCLFVQGLFAMLEMACVSFNKVRLQYYVSHRQKRAIWLNYLLNRPSLLFGTTLFGVNLALQLGSEASRRFYENMGLSPDWAPLTQILLVLLFAEIAPMSAGRKYAEHVAMLGAPILFFVSIFIRPLVWFFDLLCRAVNRLFGKPWGVGLYLSREELQHVFEQRDESKESSAIVSRIFSLKTKTAKELMRPLNKVLMVPSFCTVGEMRRLLRESDVPYLPIYQRNPQHIIGISFPRDLLRLPDDRRLKEHARAPWFITEQSSIFQILKQFRRNNQSVAVVLNEAGLAVGVLMLDEIIDEIFEQSDSWESFGEMAPRMRHIIVDRTFPGEMRVQDFNRQYAVHLEGEESETLEELVTRLLGHPPSKGESVRIDQFELTVEEPSLMGAKMISIRTVY